MFRRVLLGLTLAASLPGVLAAQEGGADRGRLNAFACGVLAIDQGFDVVLTDDSERSRQLGAVLKKAMTARGLRISGSSPYLLTLDTRAIREQARHKSPDLLEFQHNPDTPSDEVRVNIWSSRRDSIIGGRREELERASVDEVRVMVRVNDKDNGQCLWQGEVIYRLDGRNEWDTADAVVPRLAQAIGETVRNAPFNLQ